MTRKPELGFEILNQLETGLELYYADKFEPTCHADEALFLIEPQEHCGDCFR